MAIEPVKSSVKNQILFAGVDIGASRTKVVLLDKGKNIIGYDVVKSGTNFEKSASVCLNNALQMARAEADKINAIVTTGYGRNNVRFADTTSRTEISCHGKGCFHYFPKAVTIIDIGGQDNKVIKLDNKGHRISFKMNRKCAAGTGAFLEEMSARLDIGIEKMNRLAVQSSDMVRLGSFCTVFSGTEVLENIRQGKTVPDIVKGLFYSVLNRVIEMDSFSENLVMTGGVVAHNPYLVTMMEKLLERKILVPEFPQLTGALGASLYAKERIEYVRQKKD